MWALGRKIGPSFLACEHQANGYLIGAWVRENFGEDQRIAESEDINRSEKKKKQG